MGKPRQTLSQGLSASMAQKFIANPESLQSPQTIPIQQLRLPKKQPRRYFDSEKQAQLVKSVREHGILEPLLVRPLGIEDYELVAGERRYRAAQEVGLKEVPVVIRDFDDRQATQVALIENLQREDLNPVEETEGILELLAIEIKGSPEEVASILHRANHAKNRDQELEENVFLQLQAIESVLAGIGRFTAASFRTSRLPLLNLPAEVLQALRQGRLEFTKARAIARVKDSAQRQALLKDAIGQGFSLVQIKEQITSINTDSPSESVSLKQQIDRAYQRFRKSKVWDDPKQKKRLEQLLAALESVDEED